MAPPESERKSAGCVCREEPPSCSSAAVCAEPPGEAKTDTKPCDHYDYGPAPWVVGRVTSPTGAVPQVSTTLTFRDRLGSWRVRWNIKRMDYRVAPGLYAVGRPNSGSPVLVTANYKLSFDSLRHALGGLDAWILVLDTRGVNVWCAAGKGTFSTDELARRVKEADLEHVVAHRRLIVPQLGASGVSAYLVRERCGFHVVYGPVRAADLPAFLATDLKATPDMRTVRFPFRDRVALIPLEASIAWRWQTLAAVIVVAFLVGLGGSDALSAAAYGKRLGMLYGLVLLPVVGGSVIVPAALPFVPGRAFSTKGALIGVVLAAVAVVVMRPVLPPLALGAVFFGVSAASSYLAMNFTGATPFTSPSGVEKEMRWALPFQLGAGLVVVLLFVAQLVLQLVE